MLGSVGASNFFNLADAAANYSARVIGLLDSLRAEAGLSLLAWAASYSATDSTFFGDVELMGFWVIY